MRVLVLGAGAIGGYFGARLIEAGHHVRFLVRPARAAALAARGLRVHSERGDFDQRVEAVTTAAGGQVPGLVVVSCKAYDLDEAIAAIAPAVGAGTFVLPLLNGLRHLDALDRAFGAARVLGGLTHISVTLEGDGAVRHFGTLERLTWGSRDPRDAVPADIAATLGAMAEDVVASSDVIGAMWEKFAFIATLAGSTCLARAPLGALIATPEGEDLVRRLHAECCAVAARSDHRPGTDATSAALAILTTRGSPLKASMLRDIERGARTECEHVLADLRGRAASYGIDTPILSAVLAQVRIYEAARQAGSTG